MNPELLSQLRDIHGAPPASWWPPAPGWWALALVAAVGLYFLFRYARNRYRIRQRRLRLSLFIDRLVGEVDPSQAPQEFLSALNRVFKIVALHAFPGEHCALLQGREWVAFLGAKLPGKSSTDALDVLAQGPYQPAPEFNPDALVSAARRWVAQYG